KSWFGDWEHDAEHASKVVDAKTGEPAETHKIRVVYHGTSHGGFTNFDPSKGQPALFGRGFYFTESQELAREYAQTKDVEKGPVHPEIYACYLNIRKPFVIDKLGEEPAKLEGAERQALKAAMKAHPDFTVRELAENLPITSYDVFKK